MVTIRREARIYATIKRIFSVIKEGLLVQAWIMHLMMISLAMSVDETKKGWYLLHLKKHQGSILFEESMKGQMGECQPYAGSLIREALVDKMGAGSHLAILST